MTNEHKKLSRRTVAFLMPHDLTMAEVEAALTALGVQNISWYREVDSSGRPMHGGYPE